MTIPQWRMADAVIWHRGAGCNENVSQRTCFGNPMVTEPPEVILYTDGACRGNPGPGGWAVILKHPVTGTVKTHSGGARRTTNNKMELTAAIEGLRALDSNRCRRVHLVSDSEYLLLGLKEWIPKWIANNWRRGKSTGSPPVKNAALWKTLYALTQQHEMSYEHVRGHSGHPENEMCDRLAVAAIDHLANK